jgi:hypothetical protein
MASGPQSTWPAFKVPTCSCGHVIGDHVTVRKPSAHFPPRGTCLRCDCPAFDEVDETEAAA